MSSERAVELELLAIVCILLLLCFFAFYLETSGNRWMCESSAAMICGMVLGLCFLVFSPAEAPKFDDRLFFNALLPPIILEAGFNMKKSDFFSNVTTILLLAVLGTIIATLATGLLLHAWGFMSLNTCLLFGALISAVDPVATLSVFKKVKAPALLFNLVFGESVLNDAVSIVIFQIFLHLVNNNETITTKVALVAIAKLFGISLGSFALAACSSLSMAYALKKAPESLKNHPVYEVSIVLLSAYVGYLIAEIAELSGIVSLFFSGTFIAHYQIKQISDAAKTTLHQTLGVVASMTENFIFIYLGVSLFAFKEELEFHVGFIFATITLLLATRALHVFPIIQLVTRAKIVD